MVSAATLLEPVTCVPSWFAIGVVIVKRRQAVTVATSGTKLLSHEPDLDTAQRTVADVRAEV